MTPDIRWMNILQEYLSRYGFALPENPGVLNIGCGNRVKWNYLAVTYYAGCHGLGFPRYVGVDLEESAFADAKETLGELATFVAGDARNLRALVKGTYHLAVFEHPNLATSPEGPAIWRKIFKETAGLLDKDGGIILTSFGVTDHLPAQVALDRVGYEILYSGKNNYPGKMFDRADDGEPLYFDKYILVAKTNRK